MKIPFLAFALAAFLSCFNAADAAPSRFYANSEIQAEAPAAFALQPAGLAALAAIEPATFVESDALIDALEGDLVLYRAIARWEEIPLEAQLPLLRKIFDIEVRVMGITPPELVIENGATRGPAFFEFDPENPGPGKVILNPEKLAEETNPYAALLLLIHETRHSAQFQQAYRDDSIAALGYRAAFRAQKALTGRLSFCDFLTLLNEHEAFTFGNYVVGRLTQFRSNADDMGTFASQFNENGSARRIDLLELERRVGAERVLTEFNRLEEAQYRLIYGEGR